MRRVFSCFFLILLISKPAFCKSEGSYFGFNVSKYDLSAKSLKGADQSDIGASDFQIKNNDSHSFGISLKRAVNFNNLFIAPALFFDYNRVSTYGGNYNSAATHWDIDYRFGFKSDLGYDFAYGFSPYLLVGMVNTGYNNTWQYNGQASENSSSYFSPLWGVGLKYQFSKDFSLNLEYERSEIQMNVFLPADSKAKQDFYVKMLSFGISYKL